MSLLLKAALINNEIIYLIVFHQSFRTYPTGIVFLCVLHICVHQCLLVWKLPRGKCFSSKGYPQGTKDTQISVYKTSPNRMSLCLKEVQGNRSIWKEQLVVTKGSDRTLRKSSI